MPGKHTAIRTSLLCGSALSLLFSTTGFAQEVDLNEASPENVTDTEAFSLDPIIVRERDPFGEDADRATAIYVSDATLDRSRLGDLRDLFSGLSQVQVGGAIPVAQKIFVNGVDMLNLAVTVDGILQNNRAFHHVSANAFDPGLLKFVRIDPGIAAADTGPNALAGAVVMETIDAADFLADGDNFGGTARASYADNGSTFGGALTLAARNSGFETLGYFRYSNGDDYSDGAGNTVPGTAADLKSGLLKFAYESDQGHRVELSGQQLIDDALRPYRANIGAIIGGRPVPETRIYDTKRQNFSLSYENTQATGLWDPTVVVGYSSSDINVPDPFGSENTTGTWSGKIQNTFHLGATDTIDAGLDFYDRDSDYFDPFDGRLQESARNIGVFAQGRFEVGDAWKVSTGVRYDAQKFDGIGGFSDDVSGGSGNASVTYNFTEEFSVRAGYSHVFGGIQIEDGYTFFNRWDYTGLEPSTSDNITIGADWVSNNFTVGGEYFQTKIKDARNGGGNFDFESRGFNLAGTYGWVNGFLRLTYSNTRIDVDGSPADSFAALDFGAPIGQVLALEVQQAVPEWNMLIGGRVNAAASYDTAGAFSDRELEGYQVFDVFAEYTPPALQGVTFRATVNNIFDADYADRATYGADFSDVVPLKEPGRTFIIEAVAQF